MKKIIFSMMILGGLTGALPISAQDKKVYSLDECLGEAVKNNAKLRNSTNQIAMSEEQRKEAWTKYFPTVTASGMGFMAKESLIQMNVMGMDMAFAKNGVMAGVQAMQPVFMGGQIINSNKLAKVGEDVARLQRNMSENDIRLSTEQYYWSIVMLKEKLVTLDQLDRQLESVRKDAQAAVDAGIRNRNDLLQVQLRQNEVKTQRIQVQNAASTMKDLLAQVMGRAGEEIEVNYQLTSERNTLSGKTSSDFKSYDKQAANSNAKLSADYKSAEKPVGLAVVESTETYKLPESPQQLYQSPESSLAQTNEYQLLDKQIEANKLQYKLSVGKNLPSVAVGGGYTYNNIMDKSQNNLVGILTVSVPISNWWGGSHDMKRQKIQVANALNDKQDKSELLMVKMRKAWNDMTDAYKQIAIAQESVNASTENLRLNTDYYHAGTSTITDLLDAQTLYQQSRDKYVESFTNYEVKKREYLQATGR